MRQPSIVVPVPRVLRKFSGEAVFVELGNGRHVIAALASAGGFEHDFAKNIVPAHFGLSGNDHDLVKYPKLQGRWQLGSGTRPGLPTFVTFTDSKDPTTAVVVEPQDFEKIFGPGVRPPVIMIEMTKDPVTRGIEQKLPWVPHPKYLSGRSACGPQEPHCLHGGFKGS